MGKLIEPQQRRGVLEQRRRIKMAQSTHAYVRGNTAKFYDWLAGSAVAAALPQGPGVWICGDCHLGNMGPIGDSDGRISIQIRDLDQTVIGNPALDLIRLALSLQTAARGSDLPGVVSARMIEGMADAYEKAFLPRNFASPEDEPIAVSTVKRRAFGRRWKHLAHERIEGGRAAIPLGKTYWPITDEERQGIERLITSDAVRRLVLTNYGSSEDCELTIHDAAYWRKGCSSLGLLRYAVLVGITPSSGRESFGLVDIKEAVASVAPASPLADMPSEPAHRVVAGARALSPFLGDRMVAGTLLGKSVFVRELMPQDLKIEIDQFSRHQAVASARFLASVVGKAHARQMDDGARTAWLRALAGSHGPDLDAPRWLWRSVVELVSMHEAAYLDHCLAYALDTSD